MTWSRILCRVLFAPGLVGFAQAHTNHTTSDSKQCFRYSLVKEHTTTPQSLFPALTGTRPCGESLIVSLRFFRRLNPTFGYTIFVPRRCVNNFFQSFFFSPFPGRTAIKELCVSAGMERPSHTPDRGARLFSINRFPYKILVPMRSTVTRLQTGSASRGPLGRRPPVPARRP